MEISLFDVLGPVMIGPSSSHTAGAAKLARVARMIVAEPFFHVDFALHGSFADTYKGHGTDRALVAGALGFREDDGRLGSSFELAAQAGLSFSFSRADLGDVHENSVLMRFSLGERGDTAAPVRKIQGSSLGGGRVRITKIDGFDTDIALQAPTLVVMQQDLRGVISAVTAAVANFGLNIGTMKVSRKAKGETACCVIETDGEVDEALVAYIRRLPHVLYAQAVGGKETE